MQRGSPVLVVAAALAVSASPLVAQGRVQRRPLAPIPPTGEPIAPFFEGWYENADGTFTFSFGYFNLNGDQALDIPVGPDNVIEPAEFDGRQPTHFPARPRRDRGVFHVTVPASWEESQERVVWTITANGHTNSVPARVGYEALQLADLPMAMGSVPPEVGFSEAGETGRHIWGVWGDDRTATVGTPMPLSVWAKEVSVRAPEDRVNTNVSLAVTWSKYAGPVGDVEFEERRIVLEEGEGEAATLVTFHEPGDYVLRAKVDNHDANDSTGGDQCCWTNAYLRVTVGPPGR